MKKCSHHYNRYFAFLLHTPHIFGFIYTIISAYHLYLLLTLKMPYLFATKRITVQSFGNISGRISIRNTVKICSKKSFERKRSSHVFAALNRAVNF